MEEKFDEHPIESAFRVNYKMGSFENTLCFGDGSCDDVIHNLTLFLRGCGFSQRAIISGLQRQAENLKEFP